MKWLQFNDLNNTCVNLEQVVAYVVDIGHETWYIKLTHTGGVAVCGAGFSYKDPEIWLKYNKKEDRDGDLETLDAICVHGA